MTQTQLGKFLRILNVQVMADLVNLKNSTVHFVLCHVWCSHPEAAYCR